MSDEEVDPQGARSASRFVRNPEEFPHLLTERQVISLRYGGAGSKERRYRGQWLAVMKEITDAEPPRLVKGHIPEFPVDDTVDRKEQYRLAAEGAGEGRHGVLG